MRIITLEVLAVVAALVFLIMVGATALHRTVHGPESASPGSALTDCLWVVVPWLMMAACVLPSVRRIVSTIP
jgi:hypothetical protein